MKDNLKEFIAGFDLAGKRLPNGKLKCYHSENTIDNWPKEVELFGIVYTLEDTEKGKDGYETGIYA